MTASAHIEVGTRTTRRPAVTFLAWSPIAGRSKEVAAQLGGEARCYYPLPDLPRPLVPLRYAAAGLRTALYLMRRRPRAVIATAPPIFPGLIALAYSRLTQAPVLLDSHPGSFGLQGDGVSRRLLPVHRWLSRRVAGSLVTDDELVDLVRGWGGEAELLHEAPPAWTVGPARSPGARPRVVFVGIFAPDEPVQEVVEAARLLPSMDVWITGEQRKCPPGLRESAPPNVTFVGFLRGSEYPCAIASADIVITLSTERTSVVRAGYEAVYAGRPLVVSDWPGLRCVFPHAAHTANDTESIARSLRSALDRHAELVAAAPSARALQLARWEAQIASLRHRLRLPAPFAEPPGGPGPIRARRFRAEADASLPVPAQRA